VHSAVLYGMAVCAKVRRRAAGCHGPSAIPLCSAPCVCALRPRSHRRVALYLVVVQVVVDVVLRGPRALCTVASCCDGRCAALALSVVVLAVLLLPSPL
jgi:hypothetical protein